MATNFVKKMANSPLSLLWHLEMEWDIATSMCTLTAQMMPLCRVKFHGLWSSNSRVDRAQFCERLVRHGHKNWLIYQSNISGYTGPMFATFSPHESTLVADDGSVPYFPIC